MEARLFAVTDLVDPGRIAGEHLLSLVLGHARGLEHRVDDLPGIGPICPGVRVVAGPHDVVYADLATVLDAVGVGDVGEVEVPAIAIAVPNVSDTTGASTGTDASASLISALDVKRVPLIYVFLYLFNESSHSNLISFILIEEVSNFSCDLIFSNGLSNETTKSLSSSTD